MAVGWLCRRPRSAAVYSTAVVAGTVPHGGMVRPTGAVRRSVEWTRWARPRQRLAAKRSLRSLQAYESGLMTIGLRTLADSSVELCTTESVGRC